MTEVHSLPEAPGIVRSGRTNAGRVCEGGSATAGGPRSEVVDAYRVKRWVGFDGPSVSPMPKGPALFEEVRRVVSSHVRFADEWALDLTALWVMMAYIAGALPAVFYLFLSETKGRAKTTTIALLCALTGALRVSDTSVAALVHWLKEHPDGPVAFDEADAARDAERDSAIAAICRDGYLPDAYYHRWDPTAKQLDSCPTYGAKVLGYRDKVDDALEDRGFEVATGSVPGREGAVLVLRNLYREVGDLPKRLKAWSESRIIREAVRAEMTRELWMEKVAEVVGEENLGTNRDTQLAMILLAACRAAQVDLTPSLQAAFGLRREVAAANVSEELEEAREVLDGLVSRIGTLTKESEVYVVRQKDLADALNARRTDRGLRRLTSRQLAKLRNDLGIRPSWLTHPKNKATWNIPVKEWDALLGRGVANPPNPPNPTVKDGGVSQVRQVSLPPPALQVFGSDVSAPHDPEDLVCGQATRADRARGRLDREVGT